MQSTYHLKKSICICISVREGSHTVASCRGREREESRIHVRSNRCVYWKREQREGRPEREQEKVGGLVMGLMSNCQREAEGTWLYKTRRK